MQLRAASIEQCVVASKKDTFVIRTTIFPIFSNTATEVG